ncbi:MAG: hypothetical protein M1835_001739 [Candelina submexicana]|nr:MAG: hypothetical protein M1835_001739 [Candelina submexicana]
MPPKSPNPSEPSSTPLSRRRTPSYALAITITAICLLHILLIFLLSLYMVILHPSATQNYANILGIVATILSSIQYLPQLYTTFTLGSVESLSIPMMCIQTPGSFIWAASLAARLGKEGWSAWGVYVVTGTLQGGLLVMGISFELRDRRRRIMEENEGGGDRMGANGGVGNDGAGVETDDEGGHLVEGDGDDDRSQSERTPLLKRGR